MPTPSFRSRVLSLVARLGLSLAPDRRVLQKEILPALARDFVDGRVLFVGVSGATRSYPGLFPPSVLVTLDFDPGLRRFGASEHIVDRVEALGRHFPPGSLDAVVMNQVIGWGLDDPSSVNMALDACATALRTGGLLVIGISEGRTALPGLRALSALRFFEPTVLPGFGADRRVVAPLRDGASHTYLFYRRRQSASAEV